MKFSLRLLSLVLAVLTVLLVTVPALADSTPAKKVLLWSISESGKTYDTEKADQAIGKIFAESGIVMDNKSDNTEHFAAGTKLADTYGLVILYFPHLALNGTDIAVLKDFVDAGGRIFMQGENPYWMPDENGYLSAAAAQLGTSFLITYDDDMEMTAVLNPESGLIGNPGHTVSALTPNYVSRIEYSEPAILVAKTTPTQDIPDGTPFWSIRPSARAVLRFAVT